MDTKRNYRAIRLGLGALLVVILVLVWLLCQPEARLFALDAQTGRVQWSVALDGPINITPNVIVGDRRVIVNLAYSGKKGRPNERRVVALDAASGRELWGFEPASVTPKAIGDYAIDDIPIVIADNVYVRAWDTLIALDAANGQVRWTQASLADPDSARNIPIQQAGDRLVALFTEDGDYVLSLLDVQSGARIEDIWRQFGKDEYVDPYTEPFLLADDKTIFLSTSQALHAFDAQTGAQRYKLGMHSQRIWLTNDTLYVGDFEQIKALDASEGTERWRYQIDADALLRFSFLKTLRADAETVYISCSCRFDVNDEGWLFALNAQNGQERWARAVTDDKYIAGFQAVSSTPEIVFAPGGKGSQNGIMALSAADGAERWHFIANTAAYTSPANDGERVFVVSDTARWRNWLKMFNLAGR